MGSNMPSNDINYRHQVIWIICLVILCASTVGAASATTAGSYTPADPAADHVPPSSGSDTTEISASSRNKSELPYRDRVKYNDKLQHNRTWGPPIQVNHTPSRIETADSNASSEIVSYNLGTDEVTVDDTAIESRSSSPESRTGSTDQVQTEGVISNDDRNRIQNTNLFPYSAVVELQITTQTNKRYTCSGSIINESGKNHHVLTAGHCAYLHDEGGWAKSITVVPAADENVKPFYEAESTNVHTYTEWIQNEEPKFDFALLTLDRSVGNYTGAFGYGYKGEENSIYSDGSTHVAGYPGDKPPSTMWHDGDTGLGTIEEYGISDRLHKYEMDTAGGMSGGPVWVHNYDGNDEYFQLTVHAYDNSGNGFNYGTRINPNKFNDLTNWTDSAGTTVPPNDKPNLVDDGVQWANFTPQNVSSTQSVEVFNDVRNIGTAQSECFNVTYYASNDTSISSTQDFKIGSTTTCNVTPFTSKDSKFSGSIPSTIPNGTYYVGWIIDSENEVDEFSESDNREVITNTKLTVSSQTTGYPASSVPAKFDANSDGKIDQGELVDGLQAYSNDNIEQSELVDLLVAYSNSK